VATGNIKATLKFEDVSAEEMLEAGINSFKAELAEVRAEKINAEASKSLYAIYKSHKDAGFTQKQAWEILMKQMDHILPQMRPY